MSLSLVADTSPDLPTFADFWTLYPRHVAKKDAERAWHKTSPPDQMAAVVALVDWRRVWIAKDDMDHVPYPATWLNGERWTDELPRQPGRRAPATLPDLPDRTAMPDSVRTMLATLRKGTQ